MVGEISRYDDIICRCSKLPLLTDCQSSQIPCNFALARMYVKQYHYIGISIKVALPPPLHEITY